TSPAFGRSEAAVLKPRADSLLARGAVTTFGHSDRSPAKAAEDSGTPRRFALRWSHRNSDRSWSAAVLCRFWVARFDRPFQTHTLARNFQFPIPLTSRQAAFTLAEVLAAQKRQRIAALQDLSEFLWLHRSAKRLG